jgi:hypothetical protein
MREDEGSLRLDLDAMRRALDAVGGAPFLAYGFTFLLHQAHRELAEAGIVKEPAHPESALLHSGGWKRLVEAAVDKETFDRTVAGPWGLPPSRVIDFYGAVEQVGVPYPDCAQGRKHAPYWAEVLVRDGDTLQSLGVGEVGLLQLVSCLPLSAPNHSVLTEDLAEVAVEDGCPCGRRGRAFVFRGRAPRSELRGCSDVARA